MQRISRVGVGYSYADYGETVETTEEAAKNVHAFISIFFDTFSDFAGKPVHLSGESYGVSDCLSCLVFTHRSLISGPLSSRICELYLRPKPDLQSGRPPDDQFEECAHWERDNRHLHVCLQDSVFGDNPNVMVGYTLGGMR